VAETGEPYAYTVDDPLNRTDPNGELPDWVDIFDFVIAVLANAHFTFGVPHGARNSLPDTKPKPVQPKKESPKTQQPKDPESQKSSEKPQGSTNSSNAKNDKGDSKGNSSNSDPSSGNYCMDSFSGRTTVGLVDCGETGGLGGAANGEGDGGESGDDGSNPLCPVCDIFAPTAYNPHPGYVSTW
jgi:hypothetical protein